MTPDLEFNTQAVFNKVLFELRKLENRDELVLAKSFFAGGLPSPVVSSVINSCMPRGATKEEAEAIFEGVAAKLRAFAGVGDVKQPLAKATQDCTCVGHGAKKSIGDGWI